VNPHVGTPEIVASVRHLFDSPKDVLIDEQWSYVGKKENQRWLWSAIDAATGCVLAFALGRRTNDTLEKLLSKLEVFNIRTYYTDNLQGYSSLLPKEKHVVGKEYMQKIENRFLSTRTRIKRLARKTICFSKSEKLHDTVIGLYINRYCFESS
jgi:insertion element IS1 protein InsB